MRYAHGFPFTAWLQLGLVYAVGLYTAKEQGCVPRGTLITRFWRYHYFDWLTFVRRAGVYAFGGGLVAGTILFGSPDVSLKRAIHWYNSDLWKRWWSRLRQRRAATRVYNIPAHVNRVTLWAQALTYKELVGSTYADAFSTAMAA